MASIALGSTALATFALYWFSPGRLAPVTGHGRWLALAMFGLLTAVVWHRIAMDTLNHVLTRRLPVEAPRPAPAMGHRVAFLTTFVPGSEPIAMLRRTLTSMLEADYPHDTWVLDEGNDLEVRRLCTDLGVRHFSRRGVAEWNTADGTFAARTKGGNHNAWYAAHGDAYDFVAQVDTDFLVRRDFLTQTLAEFHDSSVGWVVTPQIYGNTESFIARAAGQQQFTFYGSVLRGLSARKLALMLGANHVVRVCALRSEGFYEGHLTEDLATGIKLHAAGWRSTYVPQPLAVGEGPTTWLAYTNQQMRWAFGCFDILRRVTPRRLRQLDWRARLYYLWLQQNYFSGLAFVTGTALLLAYFATGVPAASMPLMPLLLHYGPYLVWRNAHNWVMNRWNVRPDVERGLMLPGRVVGTFIQPVYFLALIGVLRGKHLSFKVTPKGGRAPRGGALTAFRPQLTVAAIMLLGMLAGFAQGHVAWAMVAWGAAVVIAMLMVPAGVLAGWALPVLRVAPARLRGMVAALFRRDRLITLPDTRAAAAAVPTPRAAPRALDEVVR
ncbi:glycosyltransferase family 2 protein [Kineococcus esterisolvens]|uniref:glycosyltransferase family 2 protein n=1 Tax=unclassified Kineococcus TaxID=2621656 RepID=UPI003D7EE6B5